MVGPTLIMSAGEVMVSLVRDQGGATPVCWVSTETVVVGRREGHNLRAQEAEGPVEPQHGSAGGSC